MDKAPTPDVARDADWKVNWIAYETPRDCTTSDPNWANVDWNSIQCSAPCRNPGDPIPTKTASRTMLTPATFQGNCELTKTVECNDKCCVQNEISHFTQWSSCSKTCGDAVRTRLKVIDQNATCGGFTPPEDPTELQQRCDYVECEYDGPWRNAADATCSKSCGGGEIAQFRHITVDGKGIHRDNCKTTRMQTCNNNPCPIDCVVSEWNYPTWEQTPCSTTCVTWTPGSSEDIADYKDEFGTKIRTRTVITQPLFGGKACPQLRGDKVCGDDFCPFHCVMDSWSTWKDPNDSSKACSKECGTGTQERTRLVLHEEKHGGICAATKQTQDCNTPCCAVDQQAP